MSEVCNTSSKRWLPYKSTNKIFFDKTPCTSLSFEKTKRSPSQNLLETFTFYHIFTIIKSEVCNSLSKCWLPNKPINKILKKRHLKSLLHLEKKLRSQSQNLLEVSTFYQIFTAFKSEFCNSSSKCWLPNKPANKMFLHKTPYTTLSFEKCYTLHYRNIHFLSHFHYF